MFRSTGRHVLGAARSAGSVRDWSQVLATSVLRRSADVSSDSLCTTGPVSSRRALHSLPGSLSISFPATAATAAHRLRPWPQGCITRAAVRTVDGACLSLSSVPGARRTLWTGIRTESGRDPCSMQQQQRRQQHHQRRYSGHQRRSYYQRSSYFGRLGDFWHRIPPPVLVWTLVGANVVVWTGWQLANVDRGKRALMQQHFTASWANLRQGRYWCLLTSMFSHVSLLHLFNNMVVLASFGLPMATLMGTRRFAALYLLSGLGGTAAHLAADRYWGSHSAVLGASGAVFGVLATYGMLWPHSRVIVLFVRVPAWAVAAGLLALDFVLPRAEVSRASHVGGAAAGALYYLLRLRMRR